MLPKLRDAILRHELILYQDVNSAYKSYETLKWMWQNSIETIIGALKSLDLLVMETWVKPLRDRFTAKRCDTIKEGVQRFYDCWQELKADKINKSIDSYPARLHEVRRLKGKMTKY